MTPPQGTTGSTHPTTVEEIKHQELGLKAPGGQAQHATVDLPFLYHQAQHYYSNSLAISTRSTYAAVQLRFQSFCCTIKATCTPTSEATLILFATHLASKRILHATIKVYLVAIRNTHVSAGLHLHYEKQLTPRLQLVLKGIKKVQSATLPVKHCLPITLDIMWRISSLLSRQPSHLHAMMYAACCLAFFTFLRVSEFTVPGDNLFDESSHLSFNSIAIDNKDNPRQLKLTIKTIQD